ncbi:darobactin export ABC transporter permease subunit [Candidatus Symbiopectobacterium sp. NZEC135]|uniref:darobactin export ABC transporter permease subunit n=1 Tax=Candidatus Symbiopectobacterium sp. NZEC135 TaxID=2820471 RepID=UPI002227A16D|nr:darobactin export ABC transporter permease subunit [Candidatus Symbiopectobacterium sp. NZEC135]MCW2477981.1 darobactin export ABC transporter permease subunit [Candidatus Symbiopectobacterium sp. NZEC135]
MFLNTFTNDIKQKPAAALLAIIITAMSLVTTFLIVMLYITDRDIERWLPEHQRLYRIESQFNLPNGDSVRSAQIPFPLVEALQKHPHIENVGYAYRLHTHLRRQGSVIPRVTVFAVTPTFMAQLHPFREDLPAPGPHDIYITADFNRHYLGLADPLGKIVDLGESGQFTIKAIVEPHPDSSLHLPAAIAFTPERIAGYPDKRLDWYDSHVYAFARLTPSHPHFDQQLLASIVANNAPQIPGAPFTPSSFLTFSAKNILDMHYGDGYADEFVKTREKSLLNTLYTAALFVLFTTVANFFNINGILNAARRPSLHIKRSLGASSAQILAESLSLFLPQFLATVTLATLLLCALFPLSADVSELLLRQPMTRLLTVFVGVTLSMGLMMLLSHLLSLALFLFGNPASQTPNRYEKQRVYYLNRMMMVVHLLVAGTTVYLWAGVMTQHHSAMHADVGYQKAHRLTFALDEGFYTLSSVRELQHRLQETAGTSAFSLSSWQPFDMSRHILNVQHAQQQVQDQFTAINTLSADKYFAQVWGLKTLAGQENTLRASTDDDVCHAIVTRAFMDAMGQKTVDEVLNTRYYIPFPEGQKALRVLRIVENFDLGEHLSAPQPLIIFINDRLEKFATVAYSNDQQEASIAAQIKRHGPPDLSLQTVQALHNRHFHNDSQMLNVITFTASMALILMVISTLVISLSDAQRLDSTLKIMEAVGGSLATNVVFFLQQHVLPMLFSLLASLALGGLLLRRWLQQYDTVAERVYVNAFAALLLLGLIVVAIMALSLVLHDGRVARPRLRRG